MSLDKKSLTEIRSIAQSMGISPRFDIGKEQLLQDISLHVSAKVVQPEKPIQVNITTPNTEGGMLTKESVIEALKGFSDLGLVVSFPDNRTWQLSCNLKRDTGTMSMSMWNVIQCARDVIKP